MKKIAIKFLLLLAAVPTFAQIENSGFENWEINSNGIEVPTGWSNEFMSLPESEELTIIKDPSSHSGSYAVTLKNFAEVRQNEDIVTKYVSMGVLFLGTLDPLDYTLPGQSINEIPATITGYYKLGAAQGSDIYDTAMVEIVLSKWDPAKERFDRLVQERLKLYETNSEYTKFTINLDYTGDIIPDKLSIILYSALPNMDIHNGTSLTIDDLSYSTVTSLSTPISNLLSAKAYPNPATVEVNFKDLPEASHSIIVKDLSGRIVKTLYLTSDNINIETSDLQSGMYLYTVLGREENALYSGKFDIKK